MNTVIVINAPGGYAPDVFDVAKELAEFWQATHEGNAAWSIELMSGYRVTRWESK